MKAFIDFTIAAHSGQKYGTEDYQVHLFSVLNKAKTYTDDETILMAAFGHDLLEDTNVTYEEIAAFDPEVARLIDLVTDQEGKNRLERHLNTYWRIRTDPMAILIKLCDRFANHNNCLMTKNISLARMYVKEYLTFKFALFEKANSRPSYLEFWQELDSQIDELKKL